jgi:peptidoglycan/xylan/chitin deacetylase (PgdA/CDA1 family)
VSTAHPTPRAWLAGLLLAAGCATACAAAQAPWPDGARGAVALTYDDALASQLDHVVPVLARAQLKATFFLANVKPADVPRWRAVAQAGHELGNHTLFHPCSAAIVPQEARYTLEAYTPQGLLREIEQQDALLLALDGRPRHGFAWPCGETKANGVDASDALRRSGLVSYARGVWESDGDLAANPAGFDAMRIPARGFDQKATAQGLIAFASKALQGGGLAIFLFHGIGEGPLDVPAQAHDALIAWLAAHRSEVWTAPLQDALDQAHAPLAIPPTAKDVSTR